MAKLVGRKGLEGHISHMWGVNAVLLKEATRLRGIADRKLEMERATTRWTKYDQSLAHKTEIRVEAATGKYSQDYLVIMEAPKMGAIALEYGHLPSGIFGPGGKFGHIKTQPPKATYLMTMTYVQA